MNLDNYSIFSDRTHPGLPTDTPAGFERQAAGFYFGNLLDTRQFLWVILAIFLLILLKAS